MNIEQLGQLVEGSGQEIIRRCQFAVFVAGRYSEIRELTPLNEQVRIIGRFRDDKFCVSYEYRILSPRKDVEIRLFETRREAEVYLMELLIQEHQMTTVEIK